MPKTRSARYDLELTFRAPELRQDPSLGLDIRREIFLILKESVTNIAKHAQCSRVATELDTDRHRMRLRVSDDGRGFDPHRDTDGNGVANMRRRAWRRSVAGWTSSPNLAAAPRSSSRFRWESNHAPGWSPYFRE